ncbi:SDR family NAD(P)-dependent oxidoreductase [Novosphingobium pentaromativorans]|uniref:Short-chain dehydrogenase/reductase SDR n=1 Tax=Novosphingobium pentaromativorans US6-1 TaxID=1088721 RepID=G6E7Z8_9SPHN|nr:SDR family NAD(P)-dependent oxidoreductase [Novosphingobium pentaromativorans]AIT81485.1 short-chain dehydrogenase [Novosphingobium pentaromativorans US6-1]EHJ62641.1 hypothetical protein NSU_0469 [Novosphingobium pentaromativorans US6-1]
MFDLSGKVALVAGAGRGVGAVIAEMLAAQGASVMVNDLFTDRARSVTAKIAASGARAISVPFDITDREAVQTCIREASDALGPVDILVNNAGVPPDFRPAEFKDMQPADWHKFVDLNLFGSVHCIEAVSAGMCERGWGRIVQISSVAARGTFRAGTTMYAASKSGIEAFVRHYSQEVGACGVTVNALALGRVERDTGEPDRRDSSGIPVGRMGTGKDVGAAVIYLASTEASWITGQTIQLNGGAYAS